jgi:hypothetical protein
MLNEDEIFMFSIDQLAIIIRGSIGIANEFYEMKGLGHDEEVYRLTIASQIQGLQVERELVRRKQIPKAEIQIYPLTMKDEYKTIFDQIVSDVKTAIVLLEAMPTRTAPEEELMKNLKELLRKYNGQSEV